MQNRKGYTEITGVCISTGAIYFHGGKSVHFFVYAYTHTDTQICMLFQLPECSVLLLKYKVRTSLKKMSRSSKTAKFSELMMAMLKDYGKGYRPSTVMYFFPTSSPCLPSYRTATRITTQLQWQRLQVKAHRKC